MKRHVFPALTLAFAMAAASASAVAQPAPASSAPGSAPAIGPGIGPGAAPGSGRGGGMGRGMGMGAGRGGMGPGMARWGQDVTPGWALMTPEERQQHQQAMSEFTDVAACRAYVRQHHAEMAARALSRGQQIPATPRRDLCAVLVR